MLRNLRIAALLSLLVPVALILITDFVVLVSFVN
jgi:hypothetical protein